MAKPLRLCADVFCPYNCASGSPHPGYTVEIAEAVFAPAGYTVVYRTASWARCKADAMAGRVDALIGTMPLESPGFVFPREAVAVSTDNFAVRIGDDFAYRGLPALDGKVIGVARGYTYLGDMGDYLARYGNDPRRVEAVSGEDPLAQNLEKLAAGHIDLVLDDGNALRAAITRLGYASKLRVTDSIHADPLYIAFAPNLGTAPALAGIFDAGMRRLRQSGRLAAILAFYHVPVAF